MVLTIKLKNESRQTTDTFDIHNPVYTNTHIVHMSSFLLLFFGTVPFSTFISSSVVSLFKMTDIFWQPSNFSDDGEGSGFYVTNPIRIPGRVPCRMGRHGYVGRKCHVEVT